MNEWMNDYVVKVKLKREWMNWKLKVREKRMMWGSVIFFECGWWGKIKEWGLSEFNIW